MLKDFREDQLPGGFDVAYIKCTYSYLFTDVRDPN